eukprot:652549-Pleurochrysis_carterae.AAC.2
MAALIATTLRRMEMAAHVWMRCSYAGGDCCTDRAAVFESRISASCCAFIEPSSSFCGEEV